MRKRLETCSAGRVRVFRSLYETSLNRTSPALGFTPAEHYAYKPFGTWLMLAEIVLFGLLPAVLLLHPKTSARRGLLIVAALLVCSGILVNRFVMTIQTLALPTLPFDQFISYLPSWQELASFGAVIAYGVIVYSVSYRYLPLFPRENKEVNHVSGR